MSSRLPSSSSAPGAAPSAASVQRRQYQTFIDRVPEAVFAFEASLKNHSRLYPPDAPEEIIAPALDAELYQGARIALRVKRGSSWQNMVVEVTEFDPPNSFAWRQVEGPYAAWTHRRRLAAFQNGTLLTEQVEYALNAGALGRIADKLFVGTQIDRIFHHRQQEAKRVIERISRIKGRDAL